VAGEEWPADVEDVVRQVSAAYRHDRVWRRIADRRAARPRGRPWWHMAAAGAALLLLMMGRALPDNPVSRTPDHRVGVRALASGPVTRFHGVPVQALAALLATRTLPLTRPTAVYWGTVDLARLRGLEQRTTSFVRPSWPPVVRVVVIRAHTMAGWIMNRPGGATIGGEDETPGVGIGFFSAQGHLLLSVSIGGLAVDELRQMGWHLRPVFWPRDWAHRLWAMPWWPAPYPGGSPASYGPDAKAAAAVLISVRTARHLDPLADQPLFPRRPPDGPVWLVETPVGVAWMVDGTTGLLVGPLPLATGWFPLRHYGSLRAVPAIPLPAPLRASAEEG
jgi:hypothetical protein